VPPYAVTVAPIANAQIEAALLWWSRNRPASRGLLANEVDRALALIEHVPQAAFQYSAHCVAKAAITRLITARTTMLMDPSVPA
jgi:hypothetical protein